MREQLNELTARRDLLLRAEEDSAYARNRLAIWLWFFLLFPALGGSAAALADLAGSSPYPRYVDVIGLLMGAVLLMVFVPLIVLTLSDLREYRRKHPGERS